jgi:hypothetical protein
MKRILLTLVALFILLTMGFKDDHGSDVSHDNTLKGDGVNVPLGISFPLFVTTTQSSPSLEIISTGPGSGGIVCTTTNGSAVFGASDNGDAVYGHSNTKSGVMGYSESIGVTGDGGNIGVFAENHENPGSHTKAYLGARCCAGDFYGNVYIHGKLDVEGAKHFMIDDPIDPSNKYLYHASVESPDMKNIYDGVLVLDNTGEGIVTMPVWFDALNKDFRYQLTAMGSPMPGLFVAEEISRNRFTISGGKAGGKVSWMVTGIRQDAWAKANPLKVEQNKPGNERGNYLHPELFGASGDKSVEKARYRTKG